MLSGEGLKTSLVSPFSLELVKHWAKLFGTFVRAPSEMKCPFCADVAGKSKLIAPRVSARRCLERCLRSSEVVQFVMMFQILRQMFRLAQKMKCLKRVLR